MTDYAQYLTETIATPGYRSTIDVHLEKLPADAADVARGWLNDTSIENSHCARALTALTKDLIGNTRAINDDVVARWRRKNDL